jgi:hypothetical protein
MKRLVAALVLVVALYAQYQYCTTNCYVDYYGGQHCVTSCL